MTEDDSSFPPARSYSCEKIPNVTVPGSDASVYMYFHIDFRVPFMKLDTHQGTEGWVGPFSVLLPDKKGEGGGE